MFYKWNDGGKKGPFLNEKGFNIQMIESKSPESMNIDSAITD